MLTLALPSGKSLEEPALAALAKAGIEVYRQGSRATFPNCPLLGTGHFLKPKRIPSFVAEGIVDAGIVGADILYDTNWWGKITCWGPVPIGRSGDGSTRIVWCQSADDPFVWPSNELAIRAALKAALESGPVLSEYPVFTRRLFDLYGVESDIVPSPGSAEAEVPLRYRFAVCLSETGRSLQENGLVGKVLMECSTLLIANPKAYANEEKRKEIYALGKALGGE